MKTENLIRSTTDFALHIVQAYINEDSIVVDATCGNGHDTLALARALSDAKAMQSMSEKYEGRLYAFDIQEEAIVNTRALLEAEGFGPQIENGRITLICDSHENMDAHVSGADVIVFNLGYLPGGDKSITTDSDTTLSAVSKAVEILHKNGLICITMYSGHEAGSKEKAELLAYARELDSRAFHVSYISMTNQPNNPPEILLITRKR